MYHFKDRLGVMLTIPKNKYPIEDETVKFDSFVTMVKEQAQERYETAIIDAVKQYAIKEKVCEATILNEDFIKTALIRATESEPMVFINDFFLCPSCNEELSVREQHKFCPECGQKIRW